MGVRTQFFAATQQELEAAVVGSVRPEFGPFGEQRRVNPFTGAVMLTTGYALLSAEPEDCDEEQIHTLVKPGRGAWKLNDDELVSLMRLLTHASDEEMAKLGRVAVLHCSQNQAFEIPDVLAKALASLDHAGIVTTATAWQQELDWPDPPTNILEELVAVASEAAAAGQRMFTYVSL